MLLLLLLREEVIYFDFKGTRGHWIRQEDGEIKATTSVGTNKIDSNATKDIIDGKKREI